MRALRILSLRLRPLLAPQRMLSALLEVSLLTWSVMLLEIVGARAGDGPADVLAFLLGAALVACLAIAARAGHLPGTSRVLAALKRGFLRAAHRLDPPSGVAFRLPASPTPRPDRGRRMPILTLVLLVVGALLLGGSILPALGWVRDHLSFTVHTLGLAVLWALYGTTTIAALLVMRTLLQRRYPHREDLARLMPPLTLLGMVGLLAWLPGWVPLALLLVVLVAGAPFALRRPIGRYYLYRRASVDAAGAGRGRAVLRVVAADAWLRGVAVLLGLLLLFIATLGQGPRLFEAVVPAGPFTLTLALGLSATAGALVLVLRSGLYLRRILGSPATWPEVPLVPTLWWPDGDLRAPWVGEARARGWAVSTGTRRPAGGFDLVVAREADARRFFPPDPDVPIGEACFRLERRFHVVKRREFRRRFQTLWKTIRAAHPGEGSGYLFCPHAWPVPGMVRDTGASGQEPVPGEEAQQRSSVGGVLVGPPYATVFPPRVRRYVAGLLGALDLDVLYWEDDVRYEDLVRVFGVLFETYDQGRFPVLDRHFVGLPQVRVVIQEADDGDDGFLEPPEGVEAPGGPLPLRARALVIRRDRGGEDIDAPDQAPATHRPEPVSV